MAEDEKQYKITKADGVSSKSSRDYTGRGYAEYANGDIYDGQFVEGVTIIYIHYYMKII